ncbi:MAG: TusE/DsrC/DsvC family sulfur relay protein [Thiohalobacteraceae bacterium]
MTKDRRIIDNPETPSARRSDRAQDLKEWDEEQGRLNATEQGIELTDDHWEVIHQLREHYLIDGPAASGRELSDMLADHFADRGGHKYLRLLFPDGPVRQGMIIAGLPVPPYTEHEGFGTSH